jgi:hypothetical protein
MSQATRDEGSLIWRTTELSRGQTPYQYSSSTSRHGAVDTLACCGFSENVDDQSLVLYHVRTGDLKSLK